MPPRIIQLGPGKLTPRMTLRIGAMSLEKYRLNAAGSALKLRPRLPTIFAFDNFLIANSRIKSPAQATDWPGGRVLE